MTKKESLKKTSLGEVIGFGTGCLVGGLAGALTGLVWQSELAVMACYGVGLTGGGLCGAWLTRRWFPSQSDPTGE